MCRNRLLGIVLVAGSVCAVGCGKQAGGSKYDTPEAVFKVFQESAKNDDWPAAARCLTERSQATMCDTLILGASFSTMGEPQKEKDLTQLLKGHGIDMAADSEPPAGPPGGGMRSIAKSAKDKPALIGELFAWLKKNSTGSGPDFRVQELGKVTVDGDRAISTVDTPRGKRPIEFQRIDGGWLISMPEEGPPARTAGDMPDLKGLANGPEGFREPEQEPVDTSDLKVDQNAGHGTIWIRDKAHELKYAIAYRTKSFDEPCTAVLLTANPIDARKLGELKKVLEREGNDLGFFLFDVSLRLLIDDQGKAQYLFAWADNVSINRSSDIDAKIASRDGRISGKASSQKADAADDEFKFRFEAEFDAPLLPIKLAANKADVTAKPEPTTEAAPAAEPEPNAAEAEQPAAAPAAETEQRAAKPAAEATATANQQLPEPATVEQAAKLLDLRTFPVIDGAQFLTGRTHVGQLVYTAKIDVSAALDFLKQHMKEVGWAEVPNARIHQGAAYTRDGFLVSLSVSEYGDQPETKGLAMISMHNHGNIAVDKLPVPPGATKEYSFPSSTMHVTAAPVEETKQKCLKLLLDLGWKPYGHAGDTFYFKRNAVKLSADVRSHEAQPGKTFIHYSTELLSADLPVPSDVDDPRYNDFDKTLTFDQAGNTVEKVVAFYNDELAAQGFKPTTKPIGDKEVAVVYRNEQKEVIFLDMTLYNDLTRVRVRHTTAAEIAEADRLFKEEQAKKELERQRREAAKPKIALPVPGKAKQVTQKNDENLEIVIARGAGTPVLEAYRKHLRDAGWSENDVDLREGSANIKFKKEESSLRFHYMEIIERGELDISGNYVTLRPNKDAPEFAPLGGLPDAEPIDAVELAKVPAHIPIPADARKLTVRSGKNVEFEVAADIKTLAEYFRAMMSKHGWTEDATFSLMSDKTASLNFKKGKKPCGISLTNVFGGDLTSVTFAGGGIDWKGLRGTSAGADPAVTDAAWRKTPAEAPKNKANSQTTKGRPAAPKSRSR